MSAPNFARVHWPENIVAHARRDWSFNPITAARSHPAFQFQNGFGLSTKAMRNALAVVGQQLKTRKVRVTMKTETKTAAKKPSKTAAHARARAAALKAWVTIRRNQRAAKAKKTNGKNGTTENKVVRLPKAAKVAALKKAA
jgi:hypothetical protein